MFFRQVNVLADGCIGIDRLLIFSHVLRQSQLFYLGFCMGIDERMYEQLFQ